MQTTVIRVDTGELWQYNLSPKEAVCNAFFQALGRGYIDKYPPAEAVVKVSPDGESVYLGDFVALNKVQG